MQPQLQLQQQQQQQPAPVQDIDSLEMDLGFTPAVDNRLAASEITDDVARSVLTPDKIKPNRAKMDPQVEALFQQLGAVDDPEKLAEQVDSYMASTRETIVSTVNLTGSGSSGMDTRLGVADGSPAARAIHEMTALMTELNPSKYGIGKPKSFISRFMPDPLKKYLRQFDSKGNSINKISSDLKDAAAHVQQSVAELKIRKVELWTSIEKLGNAAYFAETLAARVEEHLDEMAQGDPRRADILREEILSRLLVNVQDIRAVQVEAIKSYLITRTLIKTGRDVKEACDRFATYGMMTLRTAVELAMAQGLQMDTMKMLSGGQQILNELSASTAKGLAMHVDNVIAYNTQSQQDVGEMQRQIDTILNASNKFDAYRLKSIEPMKKNNAAMRDFVNKQLDNMRTAETAAASMGDILKKAESTPKVEL